MTMNIANAEDFTPSQHSDGSSDINLLMVTCIFAGAIICLFSMIQFWQYQQSKRRQALKNQFDFDFRVLSTKEEIEEAQKLLYEEYIARAPHPWTFSKSNPINIRVEWNDRLSSKILSDDFVNSAIWVGGFATCKKSTDTNIVTVPKLVGCMRIIVRQSATGHNGKLSKLEIEMYPSFQDALNAPNAQLAQQAFESKLVEVNRAVVCTEYRCMGVLTSLIGLALEYVHEHYPNHDMMTSTANPHMQRFYPAKCESMPVLEFKYEENDPATVIVFKSATSNPETYSRLSKSFASRKK